MSPEGPRTSFTVRNIQEGRAQPHEGPGLQGAATISSSGTMEVALLLHFQNMLFLQASWKPLGPAFLSLLLLALLGTLRHWQGLQLCKGLFPIPLPITLCDYPPAPCQGWAETFSQAAPNPHLHKDSTGSAVSATAHFSGDPDRVLSCYLSPQPTDP